MLILSRRSGESLTIGDEITVTVLGVTGNQIRLGITAPRDIRVLREEIYKSMQEENRAAANAPDTRRRLQGLIRQATNESEGGDP